MQWLGNPLCPVLMSTLGVRLVVLVVLAGGVILIWLDRDAADPEGFEVKPTAGGQPAGPALREKDDHHG